MTAVHQPPPRRHTHKGWCCCCPRHLGGRPLPPMLMGDQHPGGVLAKEASVEAEVRGRVVIAGPGWTDVLESLWQESSSRSSTSGRGQSAHPHPLAFTPAPLINFSCSRALGAQAGLTRAKGRAVLAGPAPGLAHSAAAADLLGDVPEGGQGASAIPQDTETGGFHLGDHVVGWGGRERLKAERGQLWLASSPGGGCPPNPTWGKPSLIVASIRRGEWLFAVQP